MRKAIAGALAFAGLLALAPIRGNAITGVLCIKATGKGAVKVRNPTCKASEVQVGSFDTTTPQANLTDVSVRVHDSGTSVSHAADTPIQFGFGSETFSFDTNDLHDEGTNPTRLTAPIAGKYYVYASGSWTAGGLGNRRQASIRLNGFNYLAYSIVAPSASAPLTNNVSIQLDLAAGDYVELVLYQDSGGSASTIGFDFGMFKAP